MEAMGHHPGKMLTQSWKLLLTVSLLGAIACSLFLRAPREPIERYELRRLVGAAVVLYAVGALASLSHRGVLAGIVYAAGILVCALAVWLSRGTDSEDPPPGGEEPTDERPPPSPDGVPEFDWASFERAFRQYSDRSDRLDRSDREPIGQ